MKSRGLVWALVFTLTASFLLPSFADAQNVLRVSRGLTSSNIKVLVNRAVVIDSAEPFTEVSVAQPEIADVSPLSDRSIYIFGRGRGSTTLTLLGEGGRLITNVTILVEPDLAELKERLGTLLPNEPIEVRTAGAGLVLSGVVSGKAKIDKAMNLARAYNGNLVTNMMSVGGTQQVNLRVKVAEIDRNIGKDIGVSTGLFRTGDESAQFSQTGTTVENNLDGTFTQLLGTAFGSFGGLFNIADTFLLDIQIDAAESKGFARSLAEPNLVALSGEEASMLVGGETPIPVTDVSTGTISIEYRPIGVSLNFLPTVLDDDLINVAVSAEVTAIDPTITSESQGLTIFGFDVQRATTTVELRDGQSFAIAGLYQNTFTDAIEQVPFLGDLPVLGSLFRSTSFQKGDSELVIIVTASLVVPVDDENQLALPTDRVGIPNEARLFLFGEIETRTAAGLVSGQELDGNYGYVME